MDQNQNDIDNAVAVRARCVRFVEEMADCANLMENVNSAEAKAGLEGHSLEAAHRIAALRALDRTMDLLRDLSPELGPRIAKPLVCLHEAVSNVHLGRDDAMLIPEKPDHRPPGDVAGERLKGTAVRRLSTSRKAGGASERQATKSLKSCAACRWIGTVLGPVLRAFPAVPFGAGREKFRFGKPRGEMLPPCSSITS